MVAGFGGLDGGARSRDPPVRLCEVAVGERKAVVSSGCGGVIAWRLGEVACGPRGRRVWNALEESTKKKAEEEEIRGWAETGCEAGPSWAVSVSGPARSARFGVVVRACLGVLLPRHRRRPRVRGAASRLALTLLPRRSLRQTDYIIINLSKKCRRSVHNLGLLAHSSGEEFRVEPRLASSDPRLPITARLRVGNWQL